MCRKFRLVLSNTTPTPLAVARYCAACAACVVMYTGHGQVWEERGGGLDWDATEPTDWLCRVGCDLTALSDASALHRRISHDSLSTLVTSSPFLFPPRIGKSEPAREGGGRGGGCAVFHMCWATHCISQSVLHIDQPAALDELTKYKARSPSDLMSVNHAVWTV